MSADGLDFGALGDVLSSLSADDLAALQGMAKSMFSGGEQQAQPQQEQSSPLGGLDLESIAKIASVMELLQHRQNDPRCDLLLALRPMLREERQKKVDQAVRMLQLISLLPQIKELGLF